LSLSRSEIAAIRTDYRLAQLSEQIAGNDPISFFLHWFDEARKAEITEVNAMTLATCDDSNRPHARIVLLKGVEDSEFIFFSNYNSNKGKQLYKNPYASLVFFWKELERQVRIEGVVKRTTADMSDAYFHSRPEGSQLGAWASPQSEIIPDREMLNERYKIFEEQFKAAIPRPPHWGGYALAPTYIEFWQGRSNRMHDRLCFEKANDQWKSFRLAP